MKTQEQYISLKSRMKTLTFRIKLKTDMTDLRKMLFDDSEEQEDFTNYQSSTICHLRNQIDKLSEEIVGWRQKLRSVYKDLNKIKSEIKSSKYDNFLQIYLKYKNLEIQNSKKSLINKHITAIDTELSVHLIWLQKSFALAVQVIKNTNLNTQQRYHYEQLERHLSDVNNRCDLKVGETSMNGIHPISSDEDVDQISTDDIHLEKKMSCRKRMFLEDYNLDDIDDVNSLGTDDEDDVGGYADTDVHTTFKMPAKRPRNLNETHILGDTDTNCNATFYIGPSSSSIKTMNNTKNGKVLTTNKSNIVSNLISEQMVKAPTNADQLKNVLLKSKKFTHGTLLRTVAAGVQKENKKFSPNHVRKSPRTVISKAIDTAASSLVKQRQATRLANGGTDAPLVRINRAASFRVKKY